MTTMTTTGRACALMGVPDSGRRGSGGDNEDKIIPDNSKVRPLCSFYEHCLCRPLRHWANTPKGTKALPSRSEDTLNGHTRHRSQ